MEPKYSAHLSNLKHITRHRDETSDIRIENCVGFTQVPLGLAGPLHIEDLFKVSGEFFAPLATYEPTLVASCARGCKALNPGGGVKFEILGEGMSRGPVFQFSCTDDAVRFARAVPQLQPTFTKDAESTSKHARLIKLITHIIGTEVHLQFVYHCGEAAGQNMTTLATQYACDQFMNSDAAEVHKVQGFLIEGQLASDKKPSWGNIKQPRGVEVIAWGSLSSSTCKQILGCTTRELWNVHRMGQEGGIRNGQFGTNINTANVLAAMFIATGQDPASVAEGCWSHLTSELDPESGDLKVSLYFPSMPVGSIGGGTQYPCQKEALGLLDCAGVGGKRKLAGIIASFSMALDLSTSAAVADGNFTWSHRRLARKQENITKRTKL